MFHVSTKQRLAALRRKYGVQLSPPRWARERSRRFKEAASAMKAAGNEAARQLVAALTPAPVGELTPAGMFATASGPGGSDDSRTTVADAPYPSQHLSATDADRLSKSQGGGGDGPPPSGSKRWIWIVLLVILAAIFAAWCGLSGKKEPPPPPPPPVQAVAPAPEPPPPPPPPPAPPPPPRELTVVKGDCLWRLSATHLGDAHAWRRLYEANRGRIRDPDLIFPGQVLELP